jgi:pantetheine-phosphate adenylyltransferase
VTSIVLYPGTFDPITLGHVDIIARAAQQFAKVIVGIGVNQLKQPLFSLEQRIELVKQAVKELANVEVLNFSGLAVDFAEQQGARLILRGFRTAGDIDYELQMAMMNRAMRPQIETLFMSAEAKFAPISSNLVREIARNGGDLSSFVPIDVAKALKK